MQSTMRTALKYLTLGLMSGVLIALRKGEETRCIIVERAKDFIQDLATPDKATSEAKRSE